jgi:hypothetical protein
MSLPNTETKDVPMQQDENGWTQCPEGTLALTLRRVRSQRQRANVLRIGVCVFTGVLACFLASRYFLSSEVELRCSQVVLLLPEYVSGDLSEKERRAVEIHLASCAKCRTILNDIKATQSVSATFDFSPIRTSRREFLVHSSARLPVTTDRGGQSQDILYHDALSLASD